MCRCLGRFQRFNVADRTELGSVSGFRAFLGGIFQTELDRINAEFARDLVEYAFDSVF